MLLPYFTHLKQADKYMSKARGLSKGINARRQGPLGATLYAAFRIPLGWKSQDVLCHFLGMRPLVPLFYLQSQWVKMVSQLIRAMTWCF